MILSRFGGHPKRGENASRSGHVETEAKTISPEFKAKAVQLVRTSGKTVAEIARDLDLTPSALGTWVKQANIGAGRGAPGALTTEERKELARLRKENKVLKEEREILKYAAAFFAKEKR